MSAPGDVELLVQGDWILTMDTARTMLRDGAVAVAGERIVAVGTSADLAARWPGARRLGGARRVVLPGMINAHQHLTGDRLARSTIPDTISSQEAIFDWAVPLHAAHTPADDELSATLGLVDAVTNGITFTVEAGTVGHPGRVLAAYDRVGVGGTLGSWGSDTEGLPFAGPVDAVIERQRDTLALTAGH
jgi:5-methylthioadenosine/S-adenosylhomocysteine deaminase